MFRESEIILNKDGSIYHLHLLPEHVAETIITVGDPGRVSLVSKFFDRIEYRLEKREFITHTGYFRDKRITVISTGIGTDNIDIVVNELHILKNTDLQTRTNLPIKTKLKIFRIGTSGSVQEHIPPDSFVVSHYAIGLDNLLYFYKYHHTKNEQRLFDAFKEAAIAPPEINPYVCSASEKLKTLFNADFHQGITITSPGFYGPQGRSIHLPATVHNFIEKLNKFRFQNLPISNIEMESSALFGLSKLLGHESISLNAILANRITGSFSTNPEKTMDRLIAHTLDIITEINY